MPFEPGTGRPPITPQLAVRVAGAGVIALILFGIVFFRLWYLQVLDGDKYLAQARDNRVRTAVIAAPRGNIVDASGLTLVQNRKATVVSINPQSLPVSYRDDIAAYGQKAGQWATNKRALIARLGKTKGTKQAGTAPARPLAAGPLMVRFRRLAQVLEMSPKTINNRVVDGVVQVPYANVRIRTDIPVPQRTFIQERQNRFPGVVVESVYLRQYPQRTLAAQILGTIGQINRDQLRSRAFRGTVAGTDIGQTGLEAQYDKYLRGTDGKYRIDVNAAGERRNATVSTEPKQGETLHLSLKLELQQAGERYLNEVGGGRPGAFVALNPEDGSIYAMGSNPSYNPRDAAPGRYSTDRAYAQKFLDAGTDHPLVNRADESAYPTGSIFKPITSLAGLSSGATTVGRIFDDTGCYRTGAREQDKACNAGRQSYGSINLIDALRVSSDTYFYDLGKRLYDKLPSQPLQQWAHKLGVARKTGVDLPNEQAGAIPSPEKVKELQNEERKCRKRTHKAFCGIAFLDSSWNPGDESNFAVGQGGLQATPLQMAVAYSTIINGGLVPTPHLGLEAENSRGYVQKIDHPTKRSVRIDPAYRAAIMQGLSEAANKDGGTSKAVWDQGWPRSRYPIFGKTGTAERFYGPAAVELDQSWYVGYSYAGNPKHKPILVVCTVEKGGFGAATAAPIVRLIMSKWFGVSPKLVRGESSDR
ncbi:penicillin-binding transpeptidase domain-containing protein [Conexibacter woesei]|uniref:penicillin-binding transpeptidase domain-containing protein n=1 Tax=Conexibacter woesei TaxID=191495 RepID=UPI0004241ABD|nr:penicillin-binding transpeptidase domain-containing protein [Conexibacter woesei]